MKPQTRRLLGTGAAAGVARTVHAEAVDSPPGPGWQAPVNNSV
jgi:hypothetical protein